MTYSEPARRSTRRIRIPRIRVVGLLLIAASVAALGSQLPASMSSTGVTPVDVPRDEHRGGLGEPGAPGERRALPDRGALGEADGAVPDGTTVFDDEVAGVANLDPDLLAALRRAATDAAGDGVEFLVDSGWRSS